MRGGYIAALVIAGLTLVGMFAAGCGLAVWGAVEGIGDTDAYGRVGVPGKANLDLPEGDVSVYFESEVAQERPEVSREDVGLSIVSGSGEPVDLRGRGGVDEEVSEGDVTRVNFDRVEIPEAGSTPSGRPSRGSEAEKARRSPSARRSRTAWSTGRATHSGACSGSSSPVRSR